MPEPKRRPRTRGNREGRPYQRSSDGKWVAVAYLPNGKPKYLYGKTSKEAADKRKELYEEIAAQRPITVGVSMTLATYLNDHWLKSTLPQRVAAGRMSASTLDSYETNVELHIIPHLGKVALADLTTQMIRDWLMELQAKPKGGQRRKLRKGETDLPEPELLSARTVAYIHAILRKALNDALDDEEYPIKRNVLLLVDAPVVTKAKTKTPTKQEAARLLAVASEHRLWAYWLLVLALGLRLGEGLGLRWERVNWEEGTLELTTTLRLQRGPKDPQTGKRKGKLVEKSLKTEASKATLPVPRSVMEALRAHRTAQAAEKLAAGRWVDHGLIFTTRLGTPLHPRNIERLWADTICRLAEVEGVRPHDLRHAAASYMHAAGVDRQVIRKTLRHTRQSTTDDIYTHVFAETHRAAADSMDTVLDGLRGKPAGGNNATKARRSAK